MELLSSSTAKSVEGWAIQGTLIEILTDFTKEFRLIGGQNFAAMRCMFKSDDRIACTVPYDTSTRAAMSLMDLRRCSCTRHRIEAYIQKDQFSELTIQLLEWVEHHHQNKYQLQHAVNGGKHLVPGTTTDCMATLLKRD